MKIVSLNVGRPMLRAVAGRQYKTAIGRRAADSPVPLTTEGLAGDHVADSDNHGGPDRAVCCYPVEHYEHWRQRLGRSLDVPSFGENLTTAGLLESEVCVGDTFGIGDAVVQISHLRQPCWKLANHLAEPQLPKWINQLGFTGWYMRVLSEGQVQAGNAVQLEDRPHPDLTVHLLNRVLRDADIEPQVIARFIDAEPLSESMRSFLAGKLRAKDR